MGRRCTVTGAPPCGQPVVMYAYQRWGLKFADESYMGHKSKSQRAIGSYKRSKSAAVLQTTAKTPDSGHGNNSNNNYKILGEEENTAVADRKIGTWNSESVLTSDPSLNPALRLAGPGGAEEIKAPGDWSRIQQTTTPPGSGLSRGGGGGPTTNERIGTIHEYSDDGVFSVSSTPPVRPARNNASSARHPGSSASSSSSSSSSSSLYSAKPLVVEQPGWVAYRESPRRAPPPTPASAPYEPSHMSSRPPLPANHDPLSVPGDFPKQTSPQQYSSHRKNMPPPPLPDADSSTQSPPTSSSQPGKLSSPHHRAAPPLTAHNGVAEETPLTLPPRDYQRRESAPVRPNPISIVKASAAGPDHDDPLSRRRSESSVSSGTPRSPGFETAQHARQPSQEELECDKQAKALAQELSDKEQKLSEVLSLDVNKKRMQYMDGLFSESSGHPGSADVTRSVSMREPPTSRNTEVTDSNKRSSLPKQYWVSPSKAMLEMEMRQHEDVGKDLTKDITDTASLRQQKEELMGKLHKKLEVLKEAKTVLQQEISDNNELGIRVCQQVEQCCPARSEKTKYQTYIDDLEKIVRLLLNLSGQLARAENAVQALAPNADEKLKKMTLDKRERLHAKHEEAKLLKDDIDKRSDQITAMLRERLSPDDFADYNHYIHMKSRLTIDLQEMEDKITLGGEQILELKKSIPDGDS